MEKYDIAIIGGGILGNTISYWLSTLYDLKICVIEKEPDVALHSSTRNSCLLYTSDAADDTPCVHLGGRRIIK